MSKLSIGFNLNTEARNIALKNALFQDINNSNYYLPNEIFRIIEYFHTNLNILQGLLSDEAEIQHKNAYLFIKHFNFKIFELGDFVYNFIVELKKGLKANHFEHESTYRYLIYKLNDENKIFVATQDNNNLVNYSINNTLYNYELQPQDLNRSVEEVRGFNINVNPVAPEDTLIENLTPVSNVNGQNKYIFLYQYLNQYNDLWKTIIGSLKTKIGELSEYYAILFKNVTVTTTLDKYPLIPKYWSILFQTTFKEYPRCFDNLEYNNDNLFYIFEIMKEKDLLKQFDKLISTSLQFDTLNY